MDLGYLIGGDTIINTATDYSNGGTITGNLVMQDSATPTKAYRLRTTGSNLDFDGGGSDLYLSTYPNEDFSGTQKIYVIYGGTYEFEKHFKKTIWDDSGDYVTIFPDTGMVINEGGKDRDTRIEGDTDSSLVFVDASTDRVGIGTGSPSTKLDVNGTVKGAHASSDGSTGITTTITSASLVGKTITIKDGLIVGFS